MCHALPFVSDHVAEGVDDIAIQGFLVFFHRQGILALLTNNLLSNLGLTAHRVNRHGTALQVKQCQDRWDSSNLIGFGIDGALGEYQAAVLRSHADEMNSLFATRAVMRATQCLAINSNDLACLARLDGLYPIKEVLLKLFGIKRSKEPTKGIVRGNAVGQGHIALQPGVFGFAKGFDRNPGVGATNHRTNRDTDDGNERMPFGVVATWVSDGGKGIIQAISNFSYCGGS